MPRGKVFCPYEDAFFPSGEFNVVDGARLHDVQPLHTATDGRLVTVVDGRVVYDDPEIQPAEKAFRRSGEEPFPE